MYIYKFKKSIMYSPPYDVVFYSAATISGFPFKARTVSNHGDDKIWLIEGDNKIYSARFQRQVRFNDQI